MQENADLNKRTDRSQDQDNNQTTAHVLLSGMRVNQETLVEKIHLDWKKRQTKEGYVSNKVHQCQKLSHELNQVNKHHDAETNLNQTSAVPAIHLSQAINIDEDPETETESALYMTPYSKLKLKLDEERKQKQETWVN
ncbi:hypothetical protein EMCG_04687 [[Emmonsia] crescens]|uniref:Uncharacterized protein n=1 Tax=[Emmonsia] crescens TaxID=73230 RepID=A0A0G2J767_9EURO|nr:hypothetical protein EMCG_04687 [Emmonsia crescens UAMH 3008]